MVVQFKPEGASTFAEAIKHYLESNPDTNTLTDELYDKLVEMPAEGPEGPEGPQGPAGNDGAPGADGTDGATWYSGSGAPSGGTGVNGDYYLRTSNSDVYQKSGGSWSVILNIKGATGEKGDKGDQGDPGSNGSNGANGADGADGATWYSGSDAPSGGTGVNGDFYLRTSNSDVYQKSGGSWSVILNIKGEQGEPGEGGGDGLLNKFDATAVPTVNDDTGDGYEVGSRWVVVSGADEGRMFQCIDASSGAAIWAEFVTSGFEETDEKETFDDDDFLAGFDSEDGDAAVIFKLSTVRSGLVRSNTAGITGADAVTNIVSLTTAEYGAIGSPNASTLYIITDAE